MGSLMSASRPNNEVEGGKQKEQAERRKNAP